MNDNVQKKIDVVIFDETRSDELKKAINPNFNIYIFKMRPCEKLFSIWIFIQYFRCLTHFDLYEVASYSRGYFHGALFQLQNIYLEARLRVIKPKAVITYIDNSHSFHWLSKHCNAFPFIAIQNGLRLSYALAGNKFHLQHYFCFGEHESKLFLKLNFKINKFYPVGSLAASLFLNKSNLVKPIKYDLLIVSSWRGNIGHSQEVIDSMTSMKTMDHMLREYINIRPIRAAIIMRSERESEDWLMNNKSEFDYFYEIYGDSVKILESNLLTGRIYLAMQESEVIISTLSTALIEAYGMGKKILYCNFVDSKKYHIDFDQLILFDRGNFQELSSRLDSLLAQSKESYLKRHYETMKWSMNYPDDGFAYKSISTLIDNIIEKNLG